MSRTATPVMDRLMSHVALGNEGGCWEWTASRRKGYGQIRIQAESGEWTTAAAHRVAYELLVGPVPAGLDLDHLCRNTICVNPDHLEPVTRRANVLRGMGPSAENARKTRCLNGHSFDGVYSTGQRRCLTCDPILPLEPRCCERCAEALPLQSRGRRRRFCSPACRVDFHNARRAA